MRTAGKRYSVRRVLAAALLAATAVAAGTAATAFAAGIAHPAAAHHALADNGVLTGDELSPGFTASLNYTFGYALGLGLEERT